MAARAPLLLLLLATSCIFDGKGGSGDDDGYTCTLIGCSSGVAFDLGLFSEASFAQLTGATIEVCFAGACRDGVLRELPPANDLRELPLTQMQEPRIAVTLARTHASGGLEIVVDVTSPAHEVFTDGDLYQVSITATDGEELVKRGWSVSYRTWQPNGPHCDPICRSAMTTTEQVQ